MNTRHILAFPLFYTLFVFADYTDSMPSSLSLSSGESSTQNAILKANNQYYTFGNVGGTSLGSDFSIQTIANPMATLTLNATKPASASTPISDFSNFYLGNVNITRTNVILNSFDEFTFTGATTLQDSSLNINMGDKRNKIIGFNNANASMNLLNSSLSSDALALNISKIGSFLHATNSNISLQNTQIDNAGSIKIQGGSAEFGAVLNIGKETRDVSDYPAIASFINDGGNVVINGNFNNGGLNNNSGINANNCVAFGACGSGNLSNLNGATTQIKGNLITKGDGGKILL